MGNANTAPDNELEKRRERYIETLKELTIMNDIFMRNVFKKRECIEHVLRIIMGIDDLQILEQIIQKDYKNLQGRSAILDCVARDAKNKRYNVEIQQESEGASYKRARYHIGLMDMNTLNPGEDYEELPDSYVIFITRNDIPGKGLPIYHADRTIEETGEKFEDGSHIIYVNSKIQDDTALGRLMHDLTCKNASEMYSEVLSKRVSELKETEEGVDTMCEELQKIYNEGEQTAKKQIAKAMLQKGMSLKDIAEVFKETEETIQTWLSEKE